MNEILLIANLLLNLYIVPLIFDLCILNLIEIANKNSTSKIEYSFKNCIISCLIPIFNIAILLFATYQVLKESHKVFFDKKNYKFAIVLVIISILYLTLTFAFSIPRGIMATIIYAIMVGIMIKG